MAGLCSYRLRDYCIICVMIIYNHVVVLEGGYCGLCGQPAVTGQHLYLVKMIELTKITLKHRTICPQHGSSDNCRLFSEQRKKVKSQMGVEGKGVSSEIYRLKNRELNDEDEGEKKICILVNS